MYIKIRASPGAKKETLEKISDSHYVISVKEPAKRNLANNRIRTLVARELGISERAVRIVSGHHSPSKIFSVEIG